MSAATAVGACSRRSRGAAWDMDRVPVASGCPSDLLERASELAALGKVLMSVRESSFGQMVLVGGEAGIGKTALLQRFCESLNPSVRLLRPTTCHRRESPRKAQANRAKRLGTARCGACVGQGISFAFPFGIYP
jgi:ABC-type hemin transport system ATPase subunit